MTTPVESLKDSIRQTVRSMKRDAPAARFIGEHVVKMLTRTVARRLSDLSPFATTHTPDTARGDKGSATSFESPSEKQVGTSLPWPHYDVMSARDIVSQLRVSPPDVCRAVSLYERGHRARATILAACDAESGSGST
jgi:hypothetical protein